LSSEQIRGAPAEVRRRIERGDPWEPSSSPSGKTTLTIGGTNLANKRYITTGQPQIAGGVIFGTYNPPRQWYATLGVRM
jgi:outer membrane receptor protein involved in Fe transport